MSESPPAPDLLSGEIEIQTPTIPLTTTNLAGLRTDQMLRGPVEMAQDPYLNVDGGLLDDYASEQAREWAQTLHHVRELLGNQAYERLRCVCCMLFPVDEMQGEAQMHEQVLSQKQSVAEAWTVQLGVCPQARQHPEVSQVLKAVLDCEAGVPQFFPEYTWGQAFLLYDGEKLKGDNADDEGAYAHHSLIWVQGNEQRADSCVSVKAFKEGPQVDDLIAAEKARLDTSQKVTEATPECFGQSGRYLFMEYFPGPSLEEYLRYHRLTPAEAYDIALQLLESVKAFNDAGIHHRDLKPEHLILQPDGKGWNVRIIDFGAADSPYALRSSPAGPNAGTAAWAAPEQCKAGGTVDEKTDLYPLALMLWKMISGINPQDLTPGPRLEASQRNRLRRLLPRVSLGRTERELMMRLADEFLLTEDRGNADRMMTLLADLQEGHDSSLKAAVRRVAAEVSAFLTASAVGLLLVEGGAPVFQRQGLVSSVQALLASRAQNETEAASLMAQEQKLDQQRIHREALHEEQYPPNVRLQPRSHAVKLEGEELPLPQSLVLTDSQNPEAFCEVHFPGDRFYHLGGQIYALTGKLRFAPPEFLAFARITGLLKAHPENADFFEAPEGAFPREKKRYQNQVFNLLDELSTSVFLIQPSSREVGAPPSMWLGTACGVGWPIIPLGEGQYSIDFSRGPQDYAGVGYWQGREITRNMSRALEKPASEWDFYRIESKGEAHPYPIPPSEQARLTSLVDGDATTMGVRAGINLSARENPPPFPALGKLGRTLPRLTLGPKALFQD